MSLIIFLAVFTLLWFPSNHVLDMFERGEISCKRVGGLTFVKFGRFGFSYYMSAAR